MVRKRRSGVDYQCFEQLGLGVLVAAVPTVGAIKCISYSSQFLNTTRYSI